jgi:hypothetical protein
VQLPQRVGQQRVGGRRIGQQAPHEVAVIGALVLCDDPGQQRVCARSIRLNGPGHYRVDELVGHELAISASPMAVPATSRWA